MAESQTSANNSMDQITSKRMIQIEEIIKSDRDFDDLFILVTAAEIEARHTSKVLKYLSENMPLQNYSVRLSLRVTQHRLIELTLLLFNYSSPI